MAYFVFRLRPAGVSRRDSRATENPGRKSGGLGRKEAAGWDGAALLRGGMRRLAIYRGFVARFRGSGERRPRRPPRRLEGRCRQDTGAGGAGVRSFPDGGFGGIDVSPPPWHRHGGAGGEGRRSDKGPGRQSPPSRLRHTGFGGFHRPMGYGRRSLGLPGYPTGSKPGQAGCLPPKLSAASAPLIRSCHPGQSAMGAVLRAISTYS